MIAKVRLVLLIALIGLYLITFPAEIQLSMNIEPGSGIEFSVSFHSESPLLAHSTIKLPDEIKTMIFNFFIDFGIYKETGLLELNRKYQYGEGSVYPLFYASKE